MSLGGNIDDVARIAAAAGSTLQAGGDVPEGAAALHYAGTFVQQADEDGLIASVEALEEQEDGDSTVAGVVDALRFLGLEDESEQVSAAFNWIEAGYPVDEGSGVKARDVRAALDARFEESLDAERLEEVAAQRIGEQPEAFGR